MARVDSRSRKITVMIIIVLHLVLTLCDVRWREMMVVFARLEKVIHVQYTVPQSMNQTVLKAEVILSYLGSHEEREALYAYAGFPPSTDCLDRGRSGPVLEQVLFLLLSPQPHKGLTMALEYLQGKGIRIFYLEG